MRLSIIIPVLNSHEIFRRQLLHLSRLDIPDDVEIIIMDDGSDPPLVDSIGVKNLSIHQTHDKRPWTWAIARNSGAKIAKGEYFFMTDLDYIITQQAIDIARKFNKDRLGFKREFGVLDEDGRLTQDMPTLLKYGLDPERAKTKGTLIAPHSNNFVIRKGLFWDLGGYQEDLVNKPYPQGEDRKFKGALLRAVEQGKATMTDEGRPTLYMFPNGKYCGDVDFNPFGLFHGLSRKKKQQNTLGFGGF